MERKQTSSSPRGKVETLNPKCSHHSRGSKGFPIAAYSTEARYHRSRQIRGHIHGKESSIREV